MALADGVILSGIFIHYLYLWLKKEEFHGKTALLSSPNVSPACRVEGAPGRLLQRPHREVPHEVVVVVVVPLFPILPLL